MIRPVTRAFALVFALLTAVAAHARVPEPGSWRAWLSTPGGELPFALELTTEPDGEWNAVVTNGPERIEVPVVRVDAETVVLDIDYYDSRIEARVEDGGRSLAGTWSKRRGPDEVAKLDFRAMHGELPRFWPIRHERGTEFRPLADLQGDWRVEFKKEADGAVARFSINEDGKVLATFLTPTGDYRYLEGVFDGVVLRLSCFDGAHAFLFHAEFTPKGTLTGDFFSGAHWHDTWTARREVGATLADPWKLTTARAGVDLAALSYLTPEGESVSLADPGFAGRVRIVEVFGTWCPNCLDASALLKDLHARYAADGLSIVGLAFEVTGDRARDSAQIKKYAERLAIDYPLLLAGQSKKDLASRAFPLVDRVRSYPTFVFLDRTGRARAVYTGFSGPATGADHERLEREFDELIRTLLAE